jgi:hypothetical protein
LINLLSRSEAERRWAAYEELRDRLRREQRQERRRRRNPANGGIQVGAGPLPDGQGGAAVIQGRF